MRTIRSDSRGVSMVEAMVALAVMAFGMLTVVGVQSTLRLNADIAKQRSEATRLAQEKLDEWRSFMVIDTAAPGQIAWSTIGNDVSTVNGSNATYEVQREVVTTVDPPTKVVRVTVSWSDRAAADANDKNQRVMLSSSIAAAAPALSGTLAVRPGTSPAAPVRRPFNRHPTIPVQARDFGDGRSAFVVPFRPWLVLVFNNVSGVITGVCDFGPSSQTFSNDTIEPADVASCADNTLAQLLSGFVRFWRTTSGPDLTAADAENPPGPALRMRMQLTLTSSGHPAGSFCIDDASYEATYDGTLPYATYFCVVQSNSSARWSGTTVVEAQRTHVTFGDIDWVIDDFVSPGARNFVVCRYTVATSDAQSVPNAAHPRNYASVEGNLVNQNFMVIPSGKHCPTDVAANPAIGDLVNSNTLQHQPEPI